MYYADDRKYIIYSENFSKSADKEKPDYKWDKIY